MLPAGTQLGPYKITAPLGAGGMGEVYRAADSRLGREVAVKVLAERFSANAELRGRFEREAQAVASLSHPNILAIHDYGTEGSSTYAVMELLEGQTLRARLDKGALPWRRAVEFGVAIAEGLAAAHAKGITHRDLKPENLFLTSGGSLKILDFGLAQIKAPAGGLDATSPPASSATEPGTVLGTVGYMAPEQVRGQPADVRSDIFSLGCVLYEMATGQRAFARETAAETMTAILHDEPVDIGSSGKQVPLEVERVIQHCLEKGRDERFQSARDLSFALKAMLSDSNASGPRMLAPHATQRPLAVWIVAACVLLGMAVASAFLLVPRLRDGAATTAAGKTGQLFDSLAILPLVNVTDDPKGEPLCEGLAEHLSGRLAQVGNLKVRPITSTARFRSQQADAKTVGRELNVNAVVTGRLRQDGETLVISLNLVDARDDSLVWSKSYPGTRQQILDLQDDIARDLASKLGLHPTSDEQQRLTKRHTENPSAYMLLTEGRFHFNKFTPEGLQTAIEFFERALKEDPNYATALAGKARCKVLLGTLYLGPRVMHPEARELFLKVLQIDPNLADARAGLGTIHLFHDWDWPAAERELKLASANSGWLALNIYGFWHAAHGQLPEALEAIKRGQELDPAAAPRRNELAMCYNWMGRYGDAIVEASKALELDPKFPLAYTQLGLAHVQQGNPEQAIAKLRSAIDAGQRHPGVVGMLGYAYAMAGQRAEAQKTLAQLEGLSPGRYGFAMPIARIHAALGDRDSAFNWLNKACLERDSGVIWLKVDPTWDSLRSDDRFDAILQEMSLAAKPAAKTDQPIDTLAVLPFENQSTDAEAGYLGDDITYSLTDSLARVRELKVRPYSSAARFKAGSFDAKAAGSQLQVQVVLRGSIQQRGQDVVIDVELIHVGDDRRLWGNRYQGKLAERLALQQQIIQEVPEKLRLSLTGQEKQVLAKLPTQSLKAHELYVQGRLEWNKRTVQGQERSIELYRRAIDLDPSYALAWASLAEAHFVSPINTDSPPKDAMLKAKDAATKALEIDDQLADAHTVLATIAGAYEWDWSEAERRYQRALALNPNNATTRYRYGQYLTVLGRFDEAQVHSARARELEPFSLIIRAVTGRHLYYARRYDAAIEQYRQALDINPNFWVAHLFLGHALAQQGHYDEAVAEFQKARQLPGANLEPLASLGHLYAVMGKTAEARQELDELRKLSQQRHVPPYYFAIMHAALGEKDRALDELDKAYEDRNLFMTLLKFEPMLDSLRDEPRFRKIVGDMKFPE